MKNFENPLSENVLSHLMAQKGQVCVSVVMPTHRLPAQRGTDSSSLSNAVLKARSELASRYAPEQVQSIMTRLDDVLQQIDFTHNTEGLGIYVGANTRHVVRFSFPVTKKIFVGDSFLIMDILYQASLTVSYYVLQQAGPRAHLYKGSNGTIQPVEDARFPFVNKDAYEYAPPSQGSSYTGNAFLQGFEKDPSIGTEIRLQSFLKQLNKQLQPYYNENQLLVVCGDLKGVSYFKEIISYNKLLCRFITRNYQHLNTTELAETIWPVVRSYQKEQNTLLINAVKEGYGTNLVLTGMESIWQAAKEGRARRLLLEKNFTTEAYIENRSGKLYLQQPPTAAVHLSNAVDELLHIVLGQKGAVAFVEDGALKRFGHLALITRY